MKDLFHIGGIHIFPAREGRVRQVRINQWTEVEVLLFTIKVGSIHIHDTDIIFHGITDSSFSTVVNSSN